MPPVDEITEPGRLLPRAEAEEIIKLFRLNFLGRFDLPKWKGSKRPAWCDFEEKNDFAETTVDVFDDSIFCEGENYYFYNEFARAVKISDRDSIRTYFLEKPLWFSPDVYIFTSEMNWCLVCNHDDDFFLCRRRNNETGI